MGGVQECESRHVNIAAGMQAAVRLSPQHMCCHTACEGLAGAGVGSADGL